MKKIQSRSGRRRPSPPPRRPNAESRTREHLTNAEVKDLLEAAKEIGRHGHRDALLILMMYRHALRVGELANLQWEQFDLKRGKLSIRRLKNGLPSIHYLERDEIKALRHLSKAYPPGSFVFISERGGPLSINSIHKIVARAGEAAGLDIAVHPHMLRHGKGYELAAKGVDTRVIQAYLGHKNIQHTVRYTEVDLRRLKGLGDDLEF